MSPSVCSKITGTRPQATIYPTRRREGAKDKCQSSQNPQDDVLSFGSAIVTRLRPLIVLLSSRLHLHGKKVHATVLWVTCNGRLATKIRRQTSPVSPEEFGTAGKISGLFFNYAVLVIKALIVLIPSLLQALQRFSPSRIRNESCSNEIWIASCWPWDLMLRAISSMHSTVQTVRRFGLILLSSM